MKITIICLLSCIYTFAQRTILVKCDSIYKNKGITLKLINFDDERDGYDGEKNCLLIITQKLKNKNSILVKDSIFSKVQKIEFEDYNNDNIKDILIQNISDVRSNWTYNLYLYNSKTNNFTMQVQQKGIPPKGKIALLHRAQWRQTLPQRKRR